MKTIPPRIDIKLLNKYNNNDRNKVMTISHYNILISYNIEIIPKIILVVNCN